MTISLPCPPRGAVRRRTGRIVSGGELVLGAALAAAVSLALSVGRYPVAPQEIPLFFLHWIGLADMPADRFEALRNVIVDIRLPRVLAAVLVGASLSGSGAAFQAVFRNPLVSPGLLGVLAGASFGAALGICLGFSWFGIQSMAFVMGVAAVGLGLVVARMFGEASLIMLVLGGMISGALFSSLTSVVKYLADPMNALPNIVYWLMGNLAQSDLAQIGWVAGPMLAGLAVLVLLGRTLDVMAMGDDEARALGVRVGAVRFLVIAAATLISALTVSVAGMIGWVGLIVPHLVRLSMGARNSRLMPASVMAGAIFLLGADYLSRSLADSEIPVGIVTELVGIPIFVLILGRARREWHE